MLFRKLFDMLSFREGGWGIVSSLEKQKNQAELDQCMKYRDLASLKKELYSKSIAIENLEDQVRGYKSKISGYQTSPPQYKLSEFHVPTKLYYGGNDWLADPNDVQLLFDGLPKGVITSKPTFIPKWMHLDFIWGENAADKVYKDLIHDALEDLEHPL